MLLKFLDVYFRNIRVKGKIPGDNIAVVIGNHRNGMIDGYILKRTIPNALFISNKEMSLVIRYFGAGPGSQVPVYRYPVNHGQKRFNHSQLKKAIALVNEGKKIVIFPEGTSKLGPSLLPLKQGVAWILNELACQNGSVRYIPLGFHYERGYEFRSIAEITFGEAREVDLAHTRDFDQLMNEIKECLLQVTINFSDQDEQRRGELFADFFTHYRNDISHYDICRLYAAKELPESMVKDFSSVIDGLADTKIPPIVFERISCGEISLGIVLSFFIAAAFILNLVPCSIAYLAAKKFADDNNVISLIRYLTGVPLLLLQVSAYIIFAHIFGLSSAVLSASGYLLITAIGIAGYHWWRDVLRKIRNCRLSRSPEMKTLLREVLLWRRK